MYKIPARTLFMGQNLVFMPECHSTNSFALDLCQQTPNQPEGTVIITSNQTAGRGQRGSTWTVEPGANLTFSVILKPVFLAINEQFYLSIFTALAIYDFLISKGCSGIRIKWPNDVYAVDKKISGTLIENQLMGSQISVAVVGIGLNINQRALPVETATSLALELNHAVDLPEALELLLHHLEVRYLQLRQEQFKRLMDDYLNVLYCIHVKSTFHSDALGTFEGIIRGVDTSGQLKLEINGMEKLFGLKEISYVRK